MMVKPIYYKHEKWCRQVWKRKNKNIKNKNEMKYNVMRMKVNKKIRKIKKYKNTM